VTQLDELMELDLLQLVSRLVDRRAAEDPSLDGSWRSVVELFAFRASTPGRAVGHELSVDEAYGLAFEAAQRSGEMDAREAVIRRVNLVVVLARGGPAVRGELLRQARVLVLRHLPMPLEAAAEKTVGWRRLPVAEIRELRYV
jgi:hypothetical protein